MDPDTPYLPGLALRAQKGDRKAFEKIVHATARLVYAQVVATVRDRQKAEDIVQETFVLAWKGIGGMTSTGAEEFLGWLLTVARHATLDAIKREGRLKRGGGGLLGQEVTDVAEKREGGPSERAEREEAMGQALAVLEELPEEYRRVLSMRYLGGADYETIRVALGLSDGALRGLLTRAMAMLRERMTGRDVTR